MMNEIKIAKFEYDDGTSINEYEYTYKTDLSLKEKAEFVVLVTNKVVSEHYNKMMYNFVFDLELIRMFADIDIEKTVLGIDENADDWEHIFALQRFMTETTVLSEIKDGIRPGLLDELKEAVDYNIEYKTGIHHNRVEDAIMGLIDLLSEKVKSLAIDSDSAKKIVELFPRFVKNTSSQEIINAIASSPEIREMALTRDTRIRNTRKNSRAKKAK